MSFLTFCSYFLLLVDILLTPIMIQLSVSTERLSRINPPDLVGRIDIHGDPMHHSWIYHSQLDILYQSDRTPIVEHESLCFKVHVLPWKVAANPLALTDTVKEGHRLRLFTLR